VAAHPQLALYQLAVAHGAVDAALGRPGRPGGAELVQLRVKGDTSPAKVQRKAPLEPGTEARSVIEGQVAEVVRRIRVEEFPVVEGPYCDHCEFQSLCPLKTSGTVLS
jgi:RecB family exonuclease